MSFAKRTDDNHKAVAAEFRAVMPDATLHDASGAGRGFPDFVVGWRGRNWLFELKDPAKPPSKRKTTPAQDTFHGGWQGQVAVVHSAAEMCAEMLRTVARIT